jgi:hypothetical protein
VNDLPPQGRGPITRKLDELERKVRSNTLQRSPGMLLSQSPTGTLMRPLNNGAAPSSPRQSVPRWG